MFVSLGLKMLTTSVWIVLFDSLSFVYEPKYVKWIILECLGNCRLVQHCKFWIFCYNSLNGRFCCFWYQNWNCRFFRTKFNFYGNKRSLEALCTIRLAIQVKIDDEAILCQIQHIMYVGFYVILALCRCYSWNIPFLLL